MARVKIMSLNTSNILDDKFFKLTININSSGVFYCDVPDFLLSCLECKHKDYHLERKYNNLYELRTKTLAQIEQVINDALAKAEAPIVTREKIIKYRISPFILFAETTDGQIVPSSHFLDAKYPADTRERYGDVSFFNARNGYNLEFGAVAATKTTTFYQSSGKKTIKFTPYFKDDIPQTEDHAWRLNQWKSLDIDIRHAKEIPYSDTAAIFFYQVIEKMAILSKKLQDAVFFEQDLLQAIANNNLLLLNREE